MIGQGLWCGHATRVVKHYERVIEQARASQEMA
jgi:hypothetical protein